MLNIIAFTSNLYNYVFISFPYFELKKNQVC